MSRRTRKRVLGDKSHRACNSHLLALPPALRRCVYLLVDTHIRKMQSSLPSPQRCIINGFFRGGIRRCYTGHRPSYWYIFRRFSVHAVKGPRRVPTSWIEERTASTRCTVNRSRARAPPPGEEGRERYLRHADSAWTNRKYDVALSPSTNPYLLLFPSRGTPFPPRVFLSLFLSSNRFVHRASIFMTQETKRQMHGGGSHLQDPPKSKLTSVDIV